MINRRQMLGLSLGAGAALALEPRLLWAARQELITRAIPSTGERLPIVGLGSSATFGQAARGEDVTALRNVFRTMMEAGGTVFDTAPSYGGSASEDVAGADRPGARHDGADVLGDQGERGPDDRRRLSASRFRPQRRNVSLHLFNGAVS